MPKKAVQTDPPPKTPCLTHPICRVENALFAKNGETSSPQLLLQHVGAHDINTMAADDLQRIQQEIGKAIVGDGDIRWIQLYIGTLLKNANIMEHATLDNTKAEEWIHRVGMAVVQAKAMAEPLGGEVQIPVWALVVLCFVVLVLVVLMITFFGVVLQKLLRNKYTSPIIDI